MKHSHNTNYISDDVLIALIEMLGKVLLACIAKSDQAKHNLLVYSKMRDDQVAKHH